MDQEAHALVHAMKPRELSTILWSLAVFDRLGCSSLECRLLEQLFASIDEASLDIRAKMQLHEVFSLCIAPSFDTPWVPLSTHSPVWMDAVVLGLHVS